MKKRLSVLLIAVFVLFTVCSTNILAEGPQLKGSPSMKVVDLTQEEYIQQLSKIKGISYMEAKASVVKPQSSNKLRSYSREETSYKQVTWTETLVTGHGVECSVISGCLVTIKYIPEYSYARWIESVDGEYVLPYGTSEYEWMGGNAIANLEGSDTIVFSAAGNIEGDVSVTISSGFDFAGFTVGAAVNGVVHVRKFHTISERFVLN